MPSKKNKNISTWKDLRKSKSGTDDANKLTFRQKVKTIFKFFKILTLSVLLVLSLWGLYYIYNNMFVEEILGVEGKGLKKIEFSTNANIDSDWICKYLDIKNDATLMNINILAMKQSLDKIKQIKFSKIERVFPDILKIDIIEYVPEYRIRVFINDKAYEYAISQEGKIFETICIAKEAFDKLPNIEGYKVKFNMSGIDDFEYIDKLNEFISYARKNNYLEKILHINVLQIDNITLPIISIITNDNVRIDFICSDYQEQFNKLDYVLKSEENNNTSSLIEKIDLTLKDRVDVKRMH